MSPAQTRKPRHQDYVFHSELPPIARPYREDFHVAALGAAG
jgi:hypothetical protein